MTRRGLSVRGAVGAAVGLAVGLAGCSADGTARVSLADPTGAPTAGTSASVGPSVTPGTADRPAATASLSSAGRATPAQTTAGPGVVLAATSERGDVALYRVAPGGRAARRLLALTPPAPGAVARDVSLSSGERPAVCIVYLLASSAPAEPRTSLHCYAPGARTGRTVVGATGPVAVAVDRDGRRAAWGETRGSGGSQELVHGTLREGVVTRQGSIPEDPSRGPDEFTGYGIGQLAWVDAGRVAVSVGVESDDGPEVRVVDLATRKGWRAGRSVSPTEADRRAGYVTYDGILGAAGMSALAVERASWMDEDRVPSRAVRVDLRDGSVEQVVAVPGERRDVVAVSGGAHALYVTEERDGSYRVVSLRWPGETKGAPVTGLPADVVTAVAQP